MATEAPGIRPLVRNPDQMKEIEQQLEKKGYDTSRLSELMSIAGKKKSLLDDLHVIDPSLNGNAEQLLKDLSVYKGEAVKKTSWLKEKLTQLGKPLSWTWEKMKKLPVLTVLALAALAAGGTVLAAYMTGNPEAVLGYLGIKHAVTGGAAAAAPGGAIGTGVLPELGAGATGAKAAIIGPEI